MVRNHLRFKTAKLTRVQIIVRLPVAGYPFVSLLGWHLRMTRVTETGFPRQTWCVHELHSFLGKLLSDHKLKYDFRYRAPAVRCVQLPFPSVNRLQNAV